MAKKSPGENNLTQIFQLIEGRENYLKSLIADAYNTFIFEIVVSLSSSGLSFSLPSDLTPSDISAQYEAGKHVVCMVNIPSAAGSTFAGLYMLPLVKKFTSGSMLFASQLAEDILFATIQSDGTITYGNPQKVQSISSSSSSANYPSAKAVYDFVIAQTGGLTFKVANTVPTVDDRSVITFVVEG